MKRFFAFVLVFSIILSFPAMAAEPFSFPARTPEPSQQPYNLLAGDQWVFPAASYDYTNLVTPFVVYSNGSSVGMVNSEIVGEIPFFVFRPSSNLLDSKSDFTIRCNFKDISGSVLPLYFFDSCMLYAKVGDLVYSCRPTFDTGYDNGSTLYFPPILSVSDDVVFWLTAPTNRFGFLIMPEDSLLSTYVDVSVVEVSCLTGLTDGGIATGLWTPVSGAQPTVPPAPSASPSPSPDPGGGGVVPAPTQPPYDDSGVREDLNKVDDSINDLKEQQQQQHEETKGFFQSIIDGIVNLPNLIIEGFKNLMLTLFVPSDDFMTNKINEVSANLEDHLGFLAWPITTSIDMIQAIAGASYGDDMSFTIPEMSIDMNGEKLVFLEETKFSMKEVFSGNENLTSILSFLRLITSMGCLGLVVMRALSMLAKYFGPIFQEAQLVDWIAGMGSVFTYIGDGLDMDEEDEEYLSALIDGGNQDEINAWLRKQHSYWRKKRRRY